MALNLARQSRSRCRIDRDTVLKINRRLPTRHRSCGDFQWPPTSESHPHVNTNTQRFDNKMLSKKQVAEISDFFDNYERYVKELYDTSHYQYISDNMTSSKSTENLKFDQHDVNGIDKMSMLEQSRKLDGENQSISTPNLCRPISSSLLYLKPLPVLRKCYYLPEEKIHSNKLLKIRQHFDKSCDVVDKQESYSTGISNKSIPAVKHDEMSIGEELKQNKINKTKNHSLVVNEEMEEICASCSCTSLNKYDQKISQLNKVLSTESNSDCSGTNKTTMIKFNESPCEPQDKPAVNESSTASTQTADIEQNSKIHLQQQPSALIKYDNAISCGKSGVGDGGDDKFKWKGNPLKQLDAFVMKQQQNHYHCKDLKAIKSSTETTSNRAMQSYEMEPQMYKHEELPEEAEIEEEQKQQERHNSILMNNDCKLHEKQQMHQYTVEQEQTSSDGTCRDKYCKNYEDDEENIATETSSSSSTPTTIVSPYEMRCCNINEISTNKSQINNKNNLNLDLYFDKELSAWMSIDGEDERKEKIEQKENNESKIDITNSKQTSSSVELISHQNELIGVDATSDFDSSSDDSTFTNCDSEASLIDTQNTIKLSDDRR